MNSFQNDLIEQVLQQVDIVQVISRYVSLKKSGRNYLGLCPFHTEKTPSFSVSPEKQIFKCFGCQKGGNVIHFIKEYEGVSFREALEMLAKEAGIDLSRYRKTEPTTKTDEKSLLLDINQKAALFYHQMLMKGDNPGLRYVRERSVRENIIREFQLGFAPDEWEILASYFKKLRLPLKKAEELGLVSLSSRGNYVDKFRNRLLFPIFDLNLHVVGFGARTLDPDSNQAKYLNSPESSVYQKSRILFGLSHSREEIRRTGYVIFVEGYFDFLRLYQEGIKNVVATSGTAFTRDHARLIQRFTDTIYLCYDGDPAGLKAIFRAALLIANFPFDIRIILLPAGEDPDSYVTKNGREPFLKLLDAPLSFQEFFTHFLKESFPLDTIQGTQRAREFILESLLQLQNEILVDRLLQEAAFLLRVSASSLEESLRHLRQLRRPSSGDQSTTVATFTTEDWPVEERELIILLLQNIPEVAGLILSQITLQDFRSPLSRQLYSAICEVYDDLGEINPAMVLATLGDDPVLSVVTQKLMQKYSNPVQYARDSIQRLQYRNIKDEIEILTQQISQFSNPAEIPEEIMNRYNQLLLELRRFHKI